MGNRSGDKPPSWSNQISIILVRPENEGNIGAISRVLMNFGMTNLRVVRPCPELTEIGYKRAKHAGNILERIEYFDDLETAISDMSFVAGTSGKRESGEKIAHRHFILPSELPSRIPDSYGNVAIIFGPEGKGLLNYELRVCDALVTIPTWEGYPIMNLSHAVSIICYEWYKKREDAQTITRDRSLNPELRSRFRDEVSRLVGNSPIQEHKKKSSEDTLNRIVMKGMPKDDEITRILSLITASADSLADEIDPS